jgi:peroxiredoxin-like protein
MEPLPHTYQVRLSGGPEGYTPVSVSVEGLPEISAALPANFDGPGGAWSPGHLLLAAVETCFLFTLRTVARASKFEFLSLELSGSGTVDRKDGAMRFTEIVLRPRLRLSPGTSKERAIRILEKSEKACIIAASLSTPVRLDAEILVG